MSKLDVIEIDILNNLVRRELEELKKDKGSVGARQYEFELRLLLHKLEVMKHEI